MTTNSHYSYLSNDVAFSKLPRKDFNRIGNAFMKFYEADHQYFPFYELPIPTEGYEAISFKNFSSKEELFEALDQACFLKHGSDSEKISTRKIIIGIYQNIDKLLEPDEDFGTSFSIPTRDPLWSGFQDMDGFYIHHQGSVWFINKSSDEDMARDLEEDDNEFWEYASQQRGSLDSSDDMDRKQYYLERDNLSN